MADIKKYMKERQGDGEEDEKTLEKKLKRHKMGKISKLIVIMVLCAAFAVGYYIYNSNKLYTTYEVVDVIERTDAYNSRYYGFGDGLLRYSQDGLVYMDNESIYWNQAFEMKEPIIDISGDYVAITDQKSNYIYIYDTEKLQGKVETAYPIVDIDVSGNGVVATITEEESELSHIEVIDKSGTKIAEGQTVLSGEGCPVDLSISEDGTKLVVSYLYVGGGTVQSKVVFYNYSEVGKNEVDRFVGAYDYDKTLMAKVEFINNDIAVAYGDDKVAIYSVKQKPSLIKCIDIEEKIKSIMYCENYIGFVVEKSSTENTYKMYIYDTEGSLVSDTDIDMLFTHVLMDGENIVFHNDTVMRVYTVSGKLKYEGEYEEGITAVAMKEKAYSYIVISPIAITTIYLK